MRQWVARASFWILASGASVPIAARAQDVGIPVGSTGPTGALETLAGDTVDLRARIGGKPAVLQFWAWWCPNCKELEPKMVAAQKKYGEKVKFVGVAISLRQTRDRAKAYAEEHGFLMDVLYDRRGLVSAAYQAPATSYVVALNAQGKVVYTGLGGDQDVEGIVAKALASSAVRTAPPKKAGRPSR